MQGACVYIDCKNRPNLVWYKEYHDKKLFYLHYCEEEYRCGKTDIYDYWKIIPEDCIHILFYLPWHNDFWTTLRIWNQLAYNKLIKLN